MHMLSTFALVLATLVSLTFSSWTSQGETRLHEVQRIYVGSMGADDEAERFRLLLEEELREKGFAVVDSPEKADGVLSGALSVRIHRNNSTARAYVTLHTAKGQKLWGRDFGSKLSNLFSLNEPVKLRAQDVASGLRRDWDKSAKLYGVKKVTSDFTSRVSGFWDPLHGPVTKVFAPIIPPTAVGGLFKSFLYQNYPEFESRPQQWADCSSPNYSSGLNK